MTTEQTDAERLADIREGVEDAVRGPWDHEDGEVWAEEADGQPVFIAEVRGHDLDAEFIAHARTDVPWLLDRLADAEGMLARTEAQIHGDDGFISQVVDLQQSLADAEARAVRAEGQVAAVEALHRPHQRDYDGHLPRDEYESCRECQPQPRDGRWPCRTRAALASDAKESGRG